MDERLRGDFSEPSIARFVDEAFAATTLKTADGYTAALGKSQEALAGLNDPFIGLAKDLAPLYQQLRDARQRRNAELSKLSALLIDVKQQYQQKDFLPDANSTLRFTYGRVRGYSPADAVIHTPISTLTGVIQKTRDEYPYATPQEVRALYKAKDFGRYRAARSRTTCRWRSSTTPTRPAATPAAR